MRAALACAALVAALAPAALAQGVDTAAAATPASPAPGSPFAAPVAEAAQRFAIPERWIWAVMHAESGGDSQAVSAAGALGLMQIMPDVWAELRLRLGLGDDPLDPRDNILAGAATLRDMYDAFGAPGFLAAYNAGPSRYADFLRGERALPLETRSYMARLAREIGETAPSATVPPAQAADDWSHASIFVSRAPDAQDARMSAASPAPAEEAGGISSPALSEPAGASDVSLFVRRGTPSR